MRDATMPLAHVSSGDAQSGDGTAAQCGGCVDGLSRIHTGESPAGSRTEVPWALSHDDNVRVQRESGCKKARMQGHCLQVTAERLTDGHRPREESTRPQISDRSREG